MSAQPEVAPGQLWADNDPRSAGRTLRVMSVDAGKAVCRIESNDAATQARLDDPRSWLGGTDRRGKTTTVSVARMVPTSTGYRLVGEEPCECRR